MERSFGPMPLRRADLFGTATLGRAGGAMFLISGLLALAIGTFVLGTVGPALVVTSAIATATGAVILAVPRAQQPNAMFVESIMAFAMLAVVSRLVPEVLEAFLPFYVLVFVTMGMTQRPFALPLAIPIASAAFLASAAGQVPEHVYGNFTLVLSVGVVAGAVLAGVTTQRRQAGEALERLVEAVATLPGAVDARATTSRLEHTVMEFLDADYVMCFLEDEPGSDRFVAVAPNQAGEYGDETIDIHAANVAMARGEAVFVADAAVDDRTAGELIADDAARSVMFVPLYGAQSLIGGCAAVWRRVVDEPTPAARVALRILTTEAGLIFERQLAAERLSAEAMTDPLTGLLNRRAIDRRLGRLRPGDVVVLVDLDDFKGVNDGAGHAAGDRTLRQLARVMHDSCRADDWCGRLGGDEFLMVLSGAGPVGMDVVTRKLRAAWAGEATLTSFSAGAALHRLGDDPTVTLKKADEALYRAKDHGRDRIELDQQ
jgi:diguanylate cyclase (GGDEF)-like protein